MEIQITDSGPFSETAQPRSRWLFSRIQSWRLILVSVVGGTLLGSAWVERVPGWAGILGLGVFFGVQLGTPNHKSALALSILTGTLAYLISCNWLLFTVEYLASTSKLWTWGLYVLVCGFQGGVFLVFAAALRCLHRLRWRILAVPGLWVLIASFYPGLYPCEVGCLLAESIELSQIAEIGGVGLVSFLAASLALLVPALSGVVWSRHPGLPTKPQNGVLLVVLLSGFGLVYCWGSAQRQAIQKRLDRVQSGAAGINVAVIQADTEKSDSHLRMYRVSRQLNDRADLILWPECTLRNLRRSVSRFASREAVGKTRQGYPHPLPGLVGKLLVGAGTYQVDPSDQSKTHFVSALLVDGQGVCGRHDKIKLMPYGEFIPGETVFPQLRSWFGGTRVIQRGTAMEPVGDVCGMKVGTVLCCEDMYPELTRDLARQDAQVLVCLGNGMAFNSRVALNQHFRIARFRAVENRRFFVRCTSHGVSAVVSPTGDVVAEIPAMEDGAFLARVPDLQLPKTFFTTHGPVVLWWMIAATLLLTLSWDSVVWVTKRTK